MSKDLKTGLRNKNETSREEGGVRKKQKRFNLMSFGFIKNTVL